MQKKILWGLVFIASLYSGVLLFMSTNQRNMQYAPGSKAIALENVAVPRAEIATISTGYLNVYGWYAPPLDGKPTILYFKGNEGSFSKEHAKFAEITNDGYGLLAFDYRGFPLSPGKINQDNILNDSLAAFDWLANKGSDIILYGRSLGTGPATYVASKRDAKALILETPFTSAADVAAERYPIFPVEKLFKDKYEVREWIKQVQEPVFVGHGTADKVIPVTHGERVFALAPNAKQLWIVENGTHGSLWDAGLWQQIQAFALNN